MSRVLVPSMPANFVDRCRLRVKRCHIGRHSSVRSPLKSRHLRQCDARAAFFKIDVCNWDAATVAMPRKRKLTHPRPCAPKQVGITADSRHQPGGKRTSSERGRFTQNGSLADLLDQSLGEVHLTRITDPKLKSLASPYPSHLPVDVQHLH